MDENSSRAPEAADSGGSPKQKRGPLAKVLTALTVFAVALVGIALLLPAPRRGREAMRRSQCLNKVKQIGLGLQNYAEAQADLPPANAIDAGAGGK